LKDDNESSIDTKSGKDYEFDYNDNRFFGNATNPVGKNGNSTSIK